MTKEELLDILTARPCEAGLAEFEAWEGDAFSYFDKHERGEDAADWCCENGALDNEIFFEWMVSWDALRVLEMEPESLYWTPELFSIAVEACPYAAQIWAPDNPHWTPELRKWAKAQ